MEKSTKIDKQQCVIHGVKHSTEYAVQIYEPYSAAMMKQIRPDQLTKNNTNQPMRWKEVCFCEDIERLKPMIINENRRIIDWNTLEVVYRYR